MHLGRLGLQVRPSTVPGAGLGLFATKDLPAGTWIPYMAPERCLVRCSLHSTAALESHFYAVQVPNLGADDPWYVCPGIIHKEMRDTLNLDGMSDEDRATAEQGWAKSMSGGGNEGKTNATILAFANTNVASKCNMELHTDGLADPRCGWVRNWPYSTVTRNIVAGEELFHSYSLEQLDGVRL